MENVVLNAFKGDWGIASIDLDCLIQLSFSKFANAPVDINFKSLGINRLPYANLPSSGKLSSYEEFTGYLKDHVRTVLVQFTFCKSSYIHHFRNSTQITIFRKARNH